MGKSFKILIKLKQVNHEVKLNFTKHQGAEIEQEALSGNTRYHRSHCGSRLRPAR